MRETIFSPCRQYRYTLWRSIQGSTSNGVVAFIGLNPSTADETLNDPTIRRCIGFARSWGYGEMCMINIFAYRATDPNMMKAQSDPTGPDNDRHLLTTAKEAALVVAAWGTHGVHRERGGKICSQILRDIKLHHLGLTKDGHPKHPLYLRADTMPVEWK